MTLCHSVMSYYTSEFSSNNMMNSMIDHTHSVMSYYTSESIAIDEFMIDHTQFID